MTGSTGSETEELKLQLIDEMIRYMKFGAAEGKDDPDFDPDFDAGYMQEHIDECAAIVDTYLASLGNVPGSGRNAVIMGAARTAVLELNALNDRCAGSLIETGQREQLCELINSAARKAGLATNEQDVTEQWREW